MILTVREICIFMIIAQAVMFFVPGSSYMKYVRVLVGILMILRITEPILTFLADDETGQEIKGRVQELWDGVDREGQGLAIEDGKMGIYRGIEEELTARLKQCPCDFEIRDVELEDEEGQIIVTIARRNSPKEIEGEIYIQPVVLGEGEWESTGRQTQEEEREEIEELKELYGNSIGISPEKIEIRYTDGKSSGR